MVYFVQTGGSGGAVKIGYAKRRVSARVQGIQIGNPEVLRLLRVIPGTRQTERLIHARFADMRIRGEWFRFDPDMLVIEVPVDAEPDDLGDVFRIDHAGHIYPLNRDARSTSALKLPLEAQARLVALANAAQVPASEMALTVLTKALLGLEISEALIESSPQQRPAVDDRWPEPPPLTGTPPLKHMPLPPAPRQWGRSA